MNEETDTLFGQLTPLPKDGKPITLWDNQDTAFDSISQAVRQAIEQLSRR